VSSGGAASFLRFLREELVPMVEVEYDVRPGDNSLGGLSFGGLFTFYVMLTQPDAFGQYFVGSPSFWWHDRVSFRLEEGRAAETRGLAAKIFMSIGANEDRDPPEGRIEDFERMRRTLRERGYSGLLLNTVIFPEETHYSVPAVSVSWAVRSLFGERD
jgi:predicted alpha/beta superfamily hydrolase